MRTLLVDDEHFVRKGLLLTVPWDRFGFEVVAEAENGVKALETMSRMEIDVLFTDLTMPKMNGFELMKQVKAQYPNVVIVVLTCHQEFEYAIAAMQTGAIDYLVKTQIEEGKMEEALARIGDRIQADAQLRESHRADPNAAGAWELLLVPLATGSQPDTLPWPEAPELKPFEDGSWLVGDHGFRDWKALHAFWEQQGLYRAWIPVVMEKDAYQGLPGKREWTGFMEYVVFYDYRSDHPVPMMFKAAPLQPTSRELQGKAIKLRASMQSLRWLYDDREFDEWVASIEEAELSADTVRDIVGETLGALSYVRSLPQETVNALAKFRSMMWYELRAWIGRLRKLLFRSDYSIDTCIGIYRALTIMQSELSEDLNQENVAQRVALSRSYFSQCFRPLAGMSFHEMLTRMRIDQAEKLLAGNEYIYVIAEKTGFSDDKYFSRIFKQHTGLLPKDFREQVRVKTLNQG